MKTSMYRLLLVMGFLIGVYAESFAYITLPSQSYTLSVGVDQYLGVPEVYPGYIDHAVWTCSKSEISFSQKDEAGAIIKITKKFSGTATIELVATEKYLDSFGRTRAQTYYKQYLITCSEGASSGVSEIILPDKISLSQAECKHFRLLAGECYNGAFSLSWKNCNPQHFATISVNWATGDIDIAGVMAGSGTLVVETATGAKKNCNIVVTSAPVVTDRRTEATALSDINSLIINTMSTVNSTVE